MQSGTVTIPLDHVQARAKHRPPGYVEDVLSSGRVIDGIVELSREAWERLRIKYRPKSPSLMELVAGFALATGPWAAAGFPVVESWVFDWRLSTCEVCENRKDGALFAGCRKCGCSELKLFLANVKCPEGQW